MAIDLSRISLRPLKLTDVDDFMLWAGDDQVTRFLRLRTFTSKEEALTNSSRMSAYPVHGVDPYASMAVRSASSPFSWDRVMTGVGQIWGMV